MIAPLAQRMGRPGAMLAAAGCLLGLLSLAGQGLAGLIDARAEVSAARAHLGRLQAASLRPAPGAPLSATDEAGLLAAFRGRLDALASGRAVVVDGLRVGPDAGSPTMPLLHAEMRGTAEGLHGLLRDLETGPPVVVVETAEIGVARSAEEAGEHPAILRLGLAARGVLLPAEGPR
ncbi:hypothetical protein J2X36_003387 [Methylobacterium sp. BE186]|uniref:hypothetical protein n=1 Tax=Methylobacterium sp. BE186 TaxID=2817715 RepID=UPI0028606E1A|nr:hypothetical protein [Methylobacterium sp. BE186]MDR7038617.1 hypothetical protein [Methylobacterium sp. BE186]